MLKNSCLNVLLLVLLGALIGTCVDGQLTFSLPEGRIVGGREAEPHGHPYQVSLQMKILWKKAHVCGGSILSEQWILTAGHCITELPLPWLLPLKVVAGAHLVNEGGETIQIRNVVEKVVHPDYNGGVAPFDLALLRLDEPLQFNKNVMPIRLPAQNSIAAGRSTLTGWGLLKTSIIPSLPQKLQAIDLPVIPYNECHKAIEALSGGAQNPLNEVANVCTGPLTGGKSACNGDSGGPLVQYDDQVDAMNGSEELGSSTDNMAKEGPVQIGVVSWGMQPCGSEGAPTVYTRVSSFVDFIEKHIRK